MLSSKLTALWKDGQQDSTSGCWCFGAHLLSVPTLCRFCHP